ncbi:polysaccharide pyruvyl transferase family protein [Methylobacterium sp. WCS2018Hpa-22]|uniref:polysaccharide pyruvyl transferase family protein n=1 Tax=Methylobacterium sp. WCS2018Hpa-22 TaxID=3073633 RepID=UPI0028891612|nr:polysaccharide pyruvyl transferase family protein [Methylobacterium sp. WCS2018Hpa-22]
MKSDITDYERWSNTDGLSLRWNNRAKFAAQFVRPGLSIVDIGCGAMAVEGIFSASSYVPCDVVQRDDRTKVIDLNAEPIPGEWFAGADVVVMLGVLEYIADIASVLRAIFDAGKPIITSYHPTNRNPDLEERSHTWISSCTVEEFESLIRECGFLIQWRYAYSGNELVYFIYPSNYSKNISDLAATADTDLFRSEHITKRPCILVAGFYGRGNCGDEALLQVIYEEFSAEYDIVISLDEHGAMPGYWDWYPYNLCNRIHQCNLAFPARPMAGMIVGGGGLPIGFAADQIYSAKRANTPIALVGTDYPRNAMLDSKASTISEYNYLRMFDYIAFRSADSVAKASDIGIKANYGADWALNLQADNSPDVSENKKRVLLVVREFPLRLAQNYYVEQIQYLHRELCEMGYEPYFLPFCDEDDRFVRTLSLDYLMPSEVQWWNARRVKQLIDQSGLVISIGRLHPMIFAATTQTPIIQLCPPLMQNIDPMKFVKIAKMSKEFTTSYYESTNDVVNAVRSGIYMKGRAATVQAAKTRLAATVSALRDLFSSNSI